MAEIVDTGGDKRLKLANEQFLRTMSFGNQWSWIRIAVQFSIAGTASITNAGLLIGLTDGVVDFNDSNTNFFGACYFGSASGPFTGGGTYNAGPPAYFLATGSTNNCLRVQKSEGVVSFVGTSSVTRYTTADLSIRNVFMVDLSRNIPVGGGTGHTVFTTNSVAVAQNDYTDEELWKQAEWQAGAAFGLTANGATYIYTGGPVLDTVLVYWNKSDPHIEISAIRIFRFS